VGDEKERERRKEGRSKRRRSTAWVRREREVATASGRRRAVTADRGTGSVGKEMERQWEGMDG